jgi:hypothetical protein
MNANGTLDRIDFENLRKQAKLARARCMKQYGASLAQYSRQIVPQRTRALMRPLHVIAVIATLFTYFGVTMLFVSPPTSVASASSNAPDDPAGVVHSNSTIEIGLPPYP